MKTKAITGIMLTLLLIGTLTLAFNIQPVKASGTVYIRADGSVEPPTAPISSVDNVTYTFTADIYDSIVVERSNIIIDGNGYTLQGSDGAGFSRGFYLSGIGNVTIKNTNIKGFSRGVYLEDSSYNSLYHNNLTSNIYYGVLLWERCCHNTFSGNNITNSDHAVYLLSSSNNTFSGNKITNSDSAVVLSRSSNNTFSGNNITNNGNGVWLYLSSNNTFSGNKITNNGYGVKLDSSSNNVLKNNSIVGSRRSFGVFDSYVQNVDTSNTIDGKPIYYLFNQHNLTINPFTNPDIGYLALIDSYNVTVDELQLKNNGQGILLVNTTSSRITNNNLTNNGYGVYLSSSSNNMVSSNNLTNNGYGVWLYLSSNNTFSGNKITNNSVSIRLEESSDNSISGNNITNNDNGVQLYSSSNNTFSGNNITNNQFHGVRLWSSNYNSISGNKIAKNRYGVWLSSSCYNMVSGNNLTNNHYGIYLYFYLSSNNTFSGNNITNNGYGVYLYWSSNNKFYHNNFINNTRQVYDISWDYPWISPSINMWDDGYPSGGNYWSDYVNEDFYSGPNQNEPGSDGIWDHPYVIDPNNKDNYPLVEPWSPKPSTPQEALEEMIETIETWKLPKGTEKSLTLKLEETLWLLEQGNENGAIHKLTDFMKQVEAQRDKKLTDEQADQLILEAQRIIDLIEG